MENVNPAYPELLADLADQTALKLTEAGIPPTKATEIGFAVAEYFRVHWSGAMIYIPKGDAYGFSQRDIELYARFNDRNYHALAKRVRAEQIKKRQGALF